MTKDERTALQIAYDQLEKAERTCRAARFVIADIAPAVAMRGRKE